jgi:AcrR family transcriptional regulator
MARPNARQLLLDAAEQIVSESGAAHLTLDAVAERAKVSKGGLLYHFPSKEALLSAMIERFVRSFNERKEQALECFPPGPACRLQAHAKEYFEHDERWEKICSSLLAAIANDPRLMDPVRDYIHSQMAATFQDFKEFAPAAMVFLAVDGLKFLDLLQLDPFTPEQREEIRQALLKAAAELK